jgi:hypothetical protein
MTLDLRKPVAVLFLLLGGLLAGFGLLSPGTRAEIDPGFNVNLVWGMGMMVFAAVLLIFSLAAQRKP